MDLKTLFLNVVELDAYTFSVPRACWLAHQTRAKQVECTGCYASLKTAGAFFDRNHVLVCHNPSDNIFWGEAEVLFRGKYNSKHLKNACRYGKKLFFWIQCSRSIWVVNYM